MSALLMKVLTSAEPSTTAAARSRVLASRSVRGPSALTAGWVPPLTCDDGCMIEPQPKQIPGVHKDVGVMYKFGDLGYVSVYADGHIRLGAYSGCTSLTP